jgi:protein RecA
MPVDPSLLPKAIAKIHETYGKNAIHKAAEKQALRRIPTGSLELDWATGGGIPIGRWAHFYGGYSSAKTTTALNVVRNAQEMGFLVALYNIENSFHEGQAKEMGIDLDKLEVVEGTTIEGVGTKLETLLGAVHVHVLDSLAAAVSVDELNAKLEEWQMGLMARAWGKVLRRANERFDDNENCVIMVNQVRDSFGYGGGESPPGGRFIEHMSSMSLYFRKAGWLYRDIDGLLRTKDEINPTIGLSGDNEPDGIEFVVRVEKSRVGRPFRVGRMRYDFRALAYDDSWALMKAARFFNVIEKTSEKSSWYKLPDGTTVQGEQKIRDALVGDKKLRTQVLKAMENAA